MKILLLASLVFLAAVAHSAECDLIDTDGETFLRKITWDIEGGRLCSGAGCSDVETVIGGDESYVGITKDDAGRLTVYFAPACWNKDGTGYVLYSGNLQPYFLKNCTLPRRTC